MIIVINVLIERIRCTKGQLFVTLTSTNRLIDNQNNPPVVTQSYNAFAKTLIDNANVRNGIFTRQQLRLNSNFVEQLNRLSSGPLNAGTMMLRSSPYAFVKCNSNNATV